jgi:hypothetical protein
MFQKREQATKCGSNEGRDIFQTGSGAHPAPIQWVPGVLSPVVKRPDREADHSPPISVKVIKIWIYTPTPHTPLLHSA